jgi:excisionase family DNA binding protein
MTNETIHLLPPPAKSPGRGAASHKLMTAVEAAILLGMDHRTLIRWARAGYVPAHPLGEGRRRMWRFFEDELVAWVEAQSNDLRKAA